MSTTVTNRSRSRTNVQEKRAIATEQTIHFGQPPPAPVEYDVLLAHEVETIDDVVTEKFASRSADGEIITNPCVHVKESIKTVGEGSYQWTRTNGDVHIERGPGLTAMQILRYPGYMQAPPVLEGPPHDLVQAAKLQAFGNLDRSPYSFAEDIAEMREVFRFVQRPWASLRDLIKLIREQATRQSARQRFRSLADATASAYLEHQFAVRPLYRSIHDAIESFMVKDPIRPKRRLARGGSDYSEHHVNQGVRITWESSSTISQETSVHAGIWYEVDNPIVDWRYKYGLRFKDIPETLWAILPLSFMVDRMYNLSQTMRGLSSFLDPNLTILGAWTTTKVDTIETITWIGHVSPIVESVQEAYTDTIVKTTESYNRQTWEPVFTDLFPDYVRLEGLIDTSEKFADTAALLWSYLRGQPTHISKVRD
jgi:hypothetical protein